MEDGKGGSVSGEVRGDNTERSRLFDFLCFVALETACLNSGAVRLQHAAQLQLWQLTRGAHSGSALKTFIFPSLKWH